jgi:amino acid transporter
MKPSNKIVAFMGAVAMAFLSAAPAYAYIGPGSGASAIGTVVAVIGAGFLLIAGFVWYPIKRLLRRGKTPAETAEESTPEEQELSQGADRES